MSQYQEELSLFERLKSLAAFAKRIRSSGWLRGDQNVNLLEKSLEAFLEFFEEPFSLPIGRGDDFYLDDIVDKIYTTIFPTS